MRTKPQYVALVVASVVLAAVAAAPNPTQAAPGARADKIKDVPDIAGEWYRDIVEWANTTPGIVQGFMAHFTDLGIVLLAATWLLVLGRARRGPAPGRWRWHWSVGLRWCSRTA